MDVISFLFKVIINLTLALIGLVTAAITFLLHRLNGTLVKRARPPTGLQEDKQPERPITRAAPQNVGAPQMQITPAVHVHVQQGQPHPLAASTPVYDHNPINQANILNRPDHGIYITTGSHLMLEHPCAEELLEQLDKMLYVAAHRDGEPFPLHPPLDDSRPNREAAFELPLIAAIDEGDFFNAEARPLPVPDGALWLRKAGQAPERHAAKPVS